MGKRVQTFLYCAYTHSTQKHNEQNSVKTTEWSTWFFHQLHKSKSFADEAPKWVRATITNILCIFIKSSVQRSTNNTIRNEMCTYSSYAQTKWIRWIRFFLFSFNIVRIVWLFLALGILIVARSKHKTQAFVRIDAQTDRSVWYLWRINVQNLKRLWSNLHNWIECWWLWGTAAENKAFYKYIRDPTSNVLMNLWAE